MEANSMNSEERTLFLDEQKERQPARFSWPIILGLVGTALFLTGLAAILSGHSDSHSGGSFLSLPASATDTRSMTQEGSTKISGDDKVVRLQPPWWVIHNVKPEGPGQDMGTWKAVTFSEEQQKHFGVDEMGKVLDKKKFDKAVSNMSKLPPWWILHNIKPAGPNRDMGTWKAITFSKEQQRHFGVDIDGKVVDKKKFDAALAASNKSNTAALPPWWILKNITPAGKKEDMGGWTAVTFSKEQQKHYGVDKDGKIIDQKKFYAVFPMLNNKKDHDDVKVAVQPPWWITANIKPAEDMGFWGTVAFSKEQQDRFGVNQDGVVLNEAKFTAALAALGKELTKDNTTNMDKDCAGGPPKNMNCTLMILFDKSAHKDQIQKLANQYEEAHPQILRSMGIVMLRYGDNVGKCCGTYKKLQETKGVASIEFDAPVHTASSKHNVGSIGMSMHEVPL